MVNVNLIFADNAISWTAIFRNMFFFGFEMYSYSLQSEIVYADSLMQAFFNRQIKVSHAKP